MTTTSLSEAQLTLKAKFDAIDAAYEAQLQIDQKTEQLAIAKIRAYGAAYVKYRAAADALEEPRS
jgi:hypothetical protein